MSRADPLAEHQRGLGAARDHTAQPLPLHRRGRSGGVQVRSGHPPPGDRRGPVHRGQPDPTGEPRAPLPRGQGQRTGTDRRPTACRPPRGLTRRWPTACSAGSWPVTCRPTSCEPTSARWPSGTSIPRPRSTSWWSRRHIVNAGAVTPADGDEVAALLVAAKAVADAEGIGGARPRLPTGLQRGTRRAQFGGPPPPPRARRSWSAVAPGLRRRESTTGAGTIG